MFPLAAENRGTPCKIIRKRLAMTTPVLICDDSAFARKQMAKAFPAEWDISVTFAEGGEQALVAIGAGKADILFLDLNMPGIDGYEVLKRIREDDLPTMVIVVSGDIQPEARERVMALGALDFIKKPVDAVTLAETLQKYGLLSEISGATRDVEIEVDVWDGYKEVANVAMGRAADLLARLLDVFVVMPIPKVNMIEQNDIRMALSDVADEDRIAAVCQGFIGRGVAGEAFLIFNESSYHDIAKLMKYDGDIVESVEMELLMDISSVLIGACLNAIAEQLDIDINQSHPVVLGRHVRIENLIKGDTLKWQRCLAIEMGYTIENHQINCDLLLLFTEDSMEELNSRVAYLGG